MEETIYSLKPYALSILKAENLPEAGHERDRDIALLLQDWQPEFRAEAEGTISPMPGNKERLAARREGFHLAWNCHWRNRRFHQPEITEALFVSNEDTRILLAYAQPQGKLYAGVEGEQPQKVRQVMAGLGVLTADTGSWHKVPIDTSVGLRVYEGLAIVHPGVHYR